MEIHLALVWSISLRREAKRHAELNTRLSLTGREDKQAQCKVKRPPEKVLL